MNHLAQAWLLTQPQVCSVITGATRLDHVLSNAEGARWKLSADELQELGEILQGDPI
jgi:aryl-alcohol dehydrogenase-like predicted oxidoreductase